MDAGTKACGLTTKCTALVDLIGQMVNTMKVITARTRNMVTDPFNGK